MDHGGEAARPTTFASAELGMAGAVRGSGATAALLGAAAARCFSFDAFFEPGAAAAYHNSAEFARHVRAAAARGEVPPVAAGFHFHHQPGPGVAYANIGEFWRHPGPVRVVLVGPQLPNGVVLLSGGEVPVAVFHREPVPGVAYSTNIGEFWQLPGQVHVVSARPQHPDTVVPVHDNNYDYSALQPRPGAAGPGVVLADLLTGGVGAVHNGAYTLVPPRRGAGHGEVLVVLPDDAGHGEVLVELLPGGDVAESDHDGYYAWQPRPGAGRGELFLGPLPDDVGPVFDNSGNFAQQTLPGIGHAEGIAGALRSTNLGTGYDGSEALADDLGAVYDNRGMVAEHLRRLLPFAGIGASSVAVNGLAAGRGSPAVAFHLLAMFLGGLFLVILHVLRV